MEPKYIVAISALSLFLILFIVFFVLLAHRRKMEAHLQAWLREMYSDRHIIKIDFESAEDEEQEIKTKESSDNTRANISEECSGEDKPKEEDTYEKLEIEGIEEITGNYIPD